MPGPNTDGSFRPLFSAATLTMSANRPANESILRPPPPSTMGTPPGWTGLGRTESPSN